MQTLARSFLVVLVLFAGASCSSEGSASSELATASTDGSPRTAQALPIAVLLGYGSGDRTLFRSAEDRLTLECMRLRGYDYLSSPVDESNPFSLESVIGSLTVERAEVSGYRLQDAENQASKIAAADQRSELAERQGGGYWDALSGGDGSCLAAARSRLYGSQNPPFDSDAAQSMFMLHDEVMQRLGSDVRLRAIGDSWRECMIPLGVDFEVLLEGRATFRPSLTEIFEPSPDEIRSAVADATCREQLRVDEAFVGLYLDVYDELQPEYQGAIEELEKLLADARRAANQVLTES